METKNISNELMKRFETDQKLGKEQKWKEYAKVCFENTKWLKEVISKYGWISSEQFGEQQELFSWLIVQHSDDLDFQKESLESLKKLPLTKQRRGHIAFLTDRVLVNEGKKQIYGTQFLNNKPYPIENIEDLDKRRKEMHLEPFEEYYSMMSK